MSSYHTSIKPMLEINPIAFLTTKTIRIDSVIKTCVYITRRNLLYTTQQRLWTAETRKISTHFNNKPKELFQSNFYKFSVKTPN